MILKLYFTTRLKLRFLVVVGDSYCFFMGFRGHIREKTNSNPILIELEQTNTHKYRRKKNINKFRNALACQNPLGTPPLRKSDTACKRPSLRRSIAWTAEPPEPKLTRRWPLLPKRFKTSFLKNKNEMEYLLVHIIIQFQIMKHFRAWLTGSKSPS